MAKCYRQVNFPPSIIQQHGKYPSNQHGKSMAPASNKFPTTSILTKPICSQSKRTINRNTTMGKSFTEPKPPPFRKDSKEFKKLVTLIQKGKVKPTDAPATVKAQYPQVFGKFTTTQFRSQWNNAKNMLGMNCK